MDYLISAPKEALPDPTVLVRDLGTNHLPDISIAVDGTEVQPRVSRRRIGGRWMWALTIPARRGIVVVRRAWHGKELERETFRIVEHVAAPTLDVSLSPQVLGTDVVTQWSTYRMPDGRDITGSELTEDDPWIVSGQEAFRANGEVVRFEIPLAPSPLVPARARHVWRWLVLGGLIATAALLVAWRRRPRVAL